LPITANPEEQKKGNKFIVDLEFFTNTEMAETTDDLTKTVDYQQVYLMIKKQMEITSKLLEHVARRIADTLSKEFPTIGAATVKVSKLSPDLGGKVEKVSVSLNKKS
jgi:7,8-dihydroneopterin aldolase/epimerase/oxygenase